ncbi:hypothetical protein [Rheinheimera maricola]|uniref:Solute-binding protein family 3/N-terminal domain-containing protein n=1 Tax=Rheinheimera maricola TaxID=2793282 RepID=A0ABS7X4N2_9GAMM|nr:hypothetical protein [Rheinheimera maricola]MBZ9610139.1 hypothetical protein [Rheinheimera maricola]
MGKFLLLILVFITVEAETLKTVITVDKDVFEDARRFLNGRDALTVTDFSTNHARRDVVDFILIQQAVALGGIKLQVRYEPGNYDARNLRSISSGMLLIGLDTFWRSELSSLQQQLYISQPLIRRGEYLAGLYTSPHNTRALAVTELQQLKKLTAVSSKNWHADWYTWQQIGPASLLDEHSWPSQAKLVSKQWVDVMLSPFLPRLPFTISSDEYQLVAVPGVKIMLDDSRHVAVSRLHPDGERVFNALQAGLTLLREQGVIDRAYTQAGFFHPAVRDWKILNPKPDVPLAVVVD